MFSISHNNKWLIRRIKIKDLSGSNMKFGERISIGLAFEEETDSTRLKEVVRRLYGVDLKAKHFKYFTSHLKDIGELLAQWISKEKTIKYTPTPEETEAGISSIGEKLQHFSTIDAIAKRMTISHNQALEIDYSVVFLMLQSDLEQAMFNRRLHKVYSAKAKKYKK